MKATTLIAALIAFICTNAQDIQLHGMLMNAYSDTVKITVYSDGEIIDIDQNTNKHYALILGARKHYTILFESGSRMKYCHLITNHMLVESIQSDIDFRSNQSVIIMQEKKSSPKYTHTIYGTGTARSIEYEKQKTE